ncbi:MAG: DUF99 family protein [Candidatus Odinarchaeota archaeon]
MNGLAMHVKDNIPVIGIDDSPFDFREDKFTLIFGVVIKGHSIIENILSAKIKVDDVTPSLTSSIASMIDQCDQKTHLKAILLNGITFGGFGIVDLAWLFKLVEIPVIAVVDHQPDYQRIKKSLLENFSDGKDRWNTAKRNGEPDPMVLNDKIIYYQYQGISREIVEKIIKKTTRSRYTQPEAIRIAHFIGTSLQRSTGKNKR